jgi:hypothetical protein
MHAFDDEQLRVLAPLALGTSRALSSGLAEDAEAAGASAFLLGFCAGFPDRQAGGELEPRVRRAVEAVELRTRHAIIARSSDLSVVAAVENAVAEALVPGAARAVTNHVVRCFEAGLATGLTM